jgi:hypothetical protein
LSSRRPFRRCVVWQLWGPASMQAALRNGHDLRRCVTQPGKALSGHVAKQPGWARLQSQEYAAVYLESLGSARSTAPAHRLATHFRTCQHSNTQLQRMHAAPAQQQQAQHCLGSSAAWQESWCRRPATCPCS